MERWSSGTQPAAVVIGLDSITGLQTARVLRRRGIPVIGLARHPRHPSCRTNACAHVVIGETSDEGLIFALEHLAPRFDERPVLFPCTDLSVLALSRGRERLAAYRTILPAPETIDILLDKVRFQAYAELAGLPAIPGRILRSRDDARQAAATLRFPCALKPGIKTAAWFAHTSAKLFVAARPSELLDRYDECRGWCDGLLAQEWIDGGDAAHVTCNAYFDAQSRPHVTFVSRKLRQWPLEGGVGCLSEACANDEVVGQTVRLFGGARHHGLAYLEMMLDARTGRYLIVEPNVGRPTGRSAAADNAGVELLHAQYCDAIGAPLPPRAGPPTRGAKWIYLRQDCQSAVQQWRRGNLTARQWARSLRGCRSDAVFSWSDPRPFVADLRKVLGKATTPPRPRFDPQAVDIDLHGLVGVRLLGASAADRAAITRQLGAASARLQRAPDIVVRFVDRLPVRGLQWIEFGRTGFTDDGFYVLQSGKRAARVRLDVETDGPLEIVSEHGPRSVPLLTPLAMTAACDHGAVPIHASAFVYDGMGILVTGWAKGGKTEALLAFAARGAEYVGDEWILLSGDGRMMHGVPESIRLQDWHLPALPGVSRRVPLARRLMFASVRQLDRLEQRLPREGRWRSAPGEVLRDALPALRRQLNVRLDPLTVFPVRRDLRASLHRVFFMVSHDDPAIRVEPADPVDIAHRMAASVAYELSPLSSVSLAYRFAFPGRRGERLDGAARVERERLAHALESKDACIVRHPYPCDLDELFEAMAGALARRRHPCTVTAQPLVGAQGVIHAD